MGGDHIEGGLKDWGGRANFQFGNQFKTAEETA